MTLCPNCGREFEGGIYCPNCGVRVEATLLPPARTPSFPEAIPPPPGTTLPPVPVSPPAPKMVKKQTFVIVTVILAILLGVTGLHVVQQTQTILFLVGENARLQTELANPTLSVWNSCGGPCSLGPGTWLTHGVPDTFTYTVSFNSTVPVAIFFFEIGQYVEFDNCGGNEACVTGSYQLFSARTSLTDGEFHLAEGCGGYVAVFKATQTGTMSPNVRVRYNPASQATGACA